jgi:hypothetical protein
LKHAPVAAIVFTPAVLPVFDDSWKTKCRTCVWFRPQSSGALHCASTEIPGYSNGVPCIAAREEGNECGPNARLWMKQR